MKGAKKNAARMRCIFFGDLSATSIGVKSYRSKAIDQKLSIKSY
jgi:hypothetical protein